MYDPKSTEVPQSFTYNDPNTGAPQGPPPAYNIANQSSVIIHNQPNVLYQTLIFGETPVRMTCTSCRADILTNTHYENGTFAWVACIFLVFVGLSLFCCLIPFCLNSCKDVVHTCPNCRVTVGRYDRIK
ncbi:LITAF domain-containing protein-like [Mytilus galloprovincialis]|uniref:LITAF domain-containing protein-like n=1 Tax=Mytilus galloprovincialis TaxID=29158 RepID=UPI003F7C8785